ncbi:MAG: hypothetical protein MMC23_002492 [Stictis urceolatum]|nr:hypothetical protein [Stictis urceolata]
MASKIIVTGSINGQLQSIFEKIGKLHAKNAFSFAIVAGDLFADPSQASEADEEALNSLLNGDLTIPLTTYFTVGSNVLPPQVVERLESNNGELVSDLFYLGKRSTTKTSEGVRIVTLGGVLDPEVIGLSKDTYPPFHSESDAKALHGANTADILLTPSWPASIRTGSKAPFPADAKDPPSEQCISDLCATLKPRYHFSSSAGLFYEREPFAHAPTEPGSTTSPTTRFISLASTSAPTKRKSLYAFTLDPSAPNPSPSPAGTTPSPLVPASNKRPRPTDEPYSRFNAHSHRPNKRRNRQPAGPEECFFCLSSPTLSTHLITSIATDTYLTTARGPLPTASTHVQLQFPAHILLIPLSHSPTLSAIQDPGVRASTYGELQRYKGALYKMIAAKGKGELGAVCWEVSRQRVRHLHWQLLPVKRALVDRGLVEAAFKVEAENEKYPGFERRDIGDGVGEGECFRVWAWAPKRGGEDGEGKDVEMKDGETADGKKAEDRTKKANGRVEVEGKEVQLMLSLDSEMKFDVQFGRRVMAKLLGLDDRLDWRDCGQTEDEEKKDAEDFKKAFKEFDFAMEED